MMTKVGGGLLGGGDGMSIIVHGLVDPLFVTSWHKWNRYKLHRGIELVPWHKEWPDGGI